MYFLINEMINELNAHTNTTATDITNEGNTRDVTASAEQIPNTCTVIGLFSFKGSEISLRSFFPNANPPSFFSLLFSFLQLLFQPF